MEPSSLASREVRPVTREDKGTAATRRGHASHDRERRAPTQAVKWRKAQADVSQPVVGDLWPELAHIISAAQGGAGHVCDWQAPAVKCEPVAIEPLANPRQNALDVLRLLEPLDLIELSKRVSDGECLPVQEPADVGRPLIQHRLDAVPLNTSLRVAADLREGATLADKGARDDLPVERGAFDKRGSSCSFELAGDIGAAQAPLEPRNDDPPCFAGERIESTPVLVAHEETLRVHDVPRDTVVERVETRPDGQLLHLA